jgi:hypothetical protein
MKRLWLAFALLAGCSGGDEGGGNGNPTSGAEGKAEAKGGPLVTITGLYESGETNRPNQLCITEGQQGGPRFGLVVWGTNLHSCSGSGTVTRAGNSLRLTMTGDETCAIEATIDGKTVTLPQTVPQGCAYYCGARASLGGVSFTQVGDTLTDAGKAKDLVGDPLCTPS